MKSSLKSHKPLQSPLKSHRIHEITIENPFNHPWTPSKTHQVAPPPTGSTASSPVSFRAPWRCRDWTWTTAQRAPWARRCCWRRREGMRPSARGDGDVAVEGKMISWVQWVDTKGNIYRKPLIFPWLCVKTYELINVSGVNTHKSHLFWCEQKGYKVLTQNHFVASMGWQKRENPNRKP